MSGTRPSVHWSSWRRGRFRTSSAVLSRRGILRTSRYAANRATSLGPLGIQPNPNSVVRELLDRTLTRCGEPFTRLVRSGHVLARRGPHVSTKHPMELRVTAKASFNCRFVQVATTAFDQAQKSLDAKPVAVLDQRKAHLGLEHTRQVAGANTQVARQLFTAHQRILAQRALYLTNHRTSLGFALGGTR